LGERKFLEIRRGKEGKGKKEVCVDGVFIEWACMRSISLFLKEFFFLKYFEDNFIYVKGKFKKIEFYVTGVRNIIRRGCGLGWVMFRA
jgi:hypothetical protein